MYLNKYQLGSSFLQVFPYEATADTSEPRATCSSYFTEAAKCQERQVTFAAQGLGGYRYKMSK